MSNEAEEKYENYYVPEQSPWPIVGAIGLFLLAFGGANFIQNTTGKYAPAATEGFSFQVLFSDLGGIIFALGLTIIVYMLWSWWRARRHQADRARHDSTALQTFSVRKVDC